MSMNTIGRGVAEDIVVFEMKISVQVRGDVGGVKSFDSVESARADITSTELAPLL